MVSGAWWRFILPCGVARAGAHSFREQGTREDGSEGFDDAMVVVEMKQGCEAAAPIRSLRGYEAPNVTRSKRTNQWQPLTMSA